MENKVLQKRSTDKRTTPRWLKQVFFDFYDPCPIDPKKDGLKSNWGKKTFANIPYSDPLPWIEKAILESKKGKTVVLLVKFDPSTKWFQRLMEEKSVVFSGFFERLQFNGSKYGAPFPSCLVFFKNA